MMLRFPFDEKKALEAMVFVAGKWHGITPFYAAKIFFLAEKEHLNRFGRPIVGDRYIAMENGPVPSVIYDWYKGNLDFMGDPSAIVEALEFNRNDRVPRAIARRSPELDYLSPSDLETLKHAINICQGKDFGELSALTHRDPAWQSTPLNTEIDPGLMIESDADAQTLERVEEFATYGVA